MLNPLSLRTFWVGMRKFHFAQFNKHSTNLSFKYPCKCFSGVNAIRYCNDKQDVLPYDDRTIQFVMAQLNCSLQDAHSICQVNYKFLVDDSAIISDRIGILKQHGISQVNIVNNSWILSYKKEELKSKLNMLEEWNFTDKNNGIQVFKFPIIKFIKYTSMVKSQFILFNSLNRITYFSSFLQCEEKRACEKFVKYNFLMVLDAKVLKQILFLVRDQGVLTEDLLDDLWLFRYSLKFISNRIQLLEEIDARSKCNTIKPWMLRCTETTLMRYFELREENIAALGPHTNIKDLLSNELDLSVSLVEEMIFKHPPLSKISYSKAKEMIEFLKGAGFNSMMIYHVPRVLCHKQATLIDRMVELRKIAPQLMNLQNLCRNKKDYISFLNKIKT